MDIKRCSSCWQRLPSSQFWLKHHGGKRLQEWCKGCMRAWRYSYREIERDQDRVRARRKRVVNGTGGGPPAQAAGEIADAVVATRE